jgi:hypothetical protein
VRCIAPSVAHKFTCEHYLVNHARATSCVSCALLKSQESELLANQIEKLLVTAKPTVTMLTGYPGLGKSYTLRALRNFYLSTVPLLYVEATPQDPQPLSVWLRLVRLLLASHFETDTEQVRSIPVVAWSSSHQWTDGACGRRRVACAFPVEMKSFHGCSVI